MGIVYGIWNETGWWGDEHGNLIHSLYPQVLEAQKLRNDNMAKGQVCPIGADGTPILAGKEEEPDKINIGRQPRKEEEPIVTRSVVEAAHRYAQGAANSYDLRKAFLAGAGWLNDTIAREIKEKLHKPALQDFFQGHATVTDSTFTIGDADRVSGDA